MLDVIKSYFHTENFLPFLKTFAIHSSFVFAVLFFTFIIFLLSKRYLMKITQKIFPKAFRFENIVFKKNIFNLFSHLIAGLFLYWLLPLAFLEIPKLAHYASIFCQIYIAVIALLIINQLINIFHKIYNTYQFSSQKPIKGFVQAAKILIYFIGFIFILSIIMNKSLGLLFGSLGAITAVIALVFKDPIMGFIASFQLSANDMVKVGDWIEMPKHDANGNVVDISLTTVKVQNFDKTIISIPAYTLVSESFKNWKGMYESGVRRIKRYCNIDIDTIKLCDKILFEKIKSNNEIYKLLKEKFDNGFNEKLTNIGLFRLYIKRYLHEHEKIRHKNMTFFIRHLQPTEVGLPIELYTFSNETSWVNYEEIQAEIFEHLLAVVHIFDLRIFQSIPSREWIKQKNIE